MNKLQELSQQFTDLDSTRLLEFGQLVVAECIKAVNLTDRRHAYTTFDRNIIDSTVDKSVQSINSYFKDQE